MGKLFYSKSRHHSKAALQTTVSPPQRHVMEKAVYVTEPILWIGFDKQKFFDQGDLFGFSSIWLEDKDLSVLMQAKCLIVCYANMYGKTINAVNFACEYGIPTLWHHKHLPPETYFWSFKHMFHSNSFRAFWGVVCSIV